MAQNWHQFLEEYKQNLQKEQQQQNGPCGLSDKQVNEVSRQHEVKSDRNTPLSPKANKPRS